jgi:hypothetical protein
MKYLVIAALVSLVFIFIYSRLRPYLQAIQKVITFLAGASASGDASGTRKSQGLESKLVRCVKCGTWIPADRAITLRAGLATYCSRECLETRADATEKKKVG